MQRDVMTAALAELRRQAEQLWAVSNKIFTTAYALEVRSTAAAISAAADQIEAELAERAA
jgi:hypothetical protein